MKKSVKALVLSIVALVFALVGDAIGFLMPFVGLILDLVVLGCGIPGLVFGIKELKGEGKKAALASVILSAIALLGVVALVGWTIFVYA